MAAEHNTKLVSSPFKHLLLNYLFPPYSVMSDQLSISSCEFLTLVIITCGNRWTLEVMMVICKFNLEVCSSQNVLVLAFS